MKNEDSSTHYLLLVPEDFFEQVKDSLTPTELILCDYFIEKTQIFLGKKCKVIAAYTGKKTFLNYISSSYIEEKAEKIAESRNKKHKKQHYEDAFNSLINKLSKTNDTFVYINYS